MHTHVNYITHTTIHIHTLHIHHTYYYTNTHRTHIFTNPNLPIHLPIRVCVCGCVRAYIYNPTVWWTLDCAEKQAFPLRNCRSRLGLQQPLHGCVPGLHPPAFQLGSARQRPHVGCCGTTAGGSASWVGAMGPLWTFFTRVLLSATITKLKTIECKKGYKSLHSDYKLFYLPVTKLFRVDSLFRKE